MPENNKNQLSREEWGQRVRALRNGSSVSPPSVRRTPVNVSGSLGQLKANLDALNGQRLGLAAGNIARQYNLADRLAQTTAELGANQIARREKLYANRQQNLNRMSQLYGNYYQQFGNVLNESALKFLDGHSNISVPTLTAIMAGYEHARASRAEQELAMLDRKSKMLEAQWAVQDKIVETQQQRDANDQLLNMQRIEAQSKANQSMYEAQKAYLDEQARNEMLGVGLASTGRGTGVRALPGMGGVARGAGRAAGRVPADVQGIRSGETVTRGAVPTGTIAQTPDGQTVAIDDNKNVMGIVTKDANGQSVVKNENGQTVATVDGNGNVIQQVEREAGPYEQYLAAVGGYSDPLIMATGAVGISAGLGALGESARLGYVNPDTRSLVNAYDQSIKALRSSAQNVRNANFALRASVGAIDPRSVTSTPVMENYLRQLDLLDRQGIQLDPARRQALDNHRQYQNARNVYLRDAPFQRTTRAGSLSALGGREGLTAAQNTIQRADNAGRIARATGATLRGAGRFGGDIARGLARRALTRAGTAAAAGSIGGPAGTVLGGLLGLGLTAVDLLPYAPGLAVGAVQGVGQGLSNIFSSGSYSRDVANAIANGEPIPTRRSAWSAFNEGRVGTNQWLGSLGYDRLMRNPQDVDNFGKFYEERTGSTLDRDTKIMFDNQSDVVRTAILDGMLTNNFTKPEQVHEFIRDVINTHSTPQEQEAIQQQIQAEDDQRVFEQSRAANGDNQLVKAVTEQLQGELTRLGYNFDYEDVARFGIDYTKMVPWIETRNKVGAGNSQSSATSMYQITKPFFDNQRSYILKNFGHLLPPEQKDRLVKATSARDLDNDLDRPIIQAMVLANIYNNVSVNNQHFDKQGPNIQSVQMAGDIISMMKASSDAGQVDGEGYVDDPFIDGNLARLWATNFFRGTDSKAVRDAYNNVVNALNEKRGFNRDEQGNNLPWWDGSWMTPQRHREILGMPVSDAQQAAYGFDVAPGVDVDNLNTLLLQRFSAANDAMVSATGVKGRANSGHRTTAKQTELYNNRANNSNPVGRPGWSFHQSGMALDFNNDEWEKAFNGNNQLKHDYGTFDNFLNSFGLQRGITGKNGKRRDLVHLTMVQDDEYHNTIDHDRLMASRGKWGDQGGNHWMRGVGERPQQVQPAWDVGMQAMLNNFGYPQVVEYPGTEYDPDTIFAGNQDGYVFDYDYDEDGNLISY